MVLALDEGSGLAHVPLFRGALVRKEERLSTEVVALPLSIPVASPREVGGH